MRRFAASSTLAGATGFEVCAPLSHKGFGNRGGAWSIFADPSLRHYRWEQERYWPWYLLFGRLGYHGDASPDVWRREWAARFGREAAPHLERALQAASGVLPLLTARHSPSASVFGYWPEKDMGGLLDLYLQVPASDVAMFASAQETAAARLGGTPDARQTPQESGAAFSRFATEAEAALERALATATPADRERRPRAARGGPGRPRPGHPRPLPRRQAAPPPRTWPPSTPRATWTPSSPPAPPRRKPSPPGSSWSRLTDGVYQDDLIFGRPDDQDGHWKDNLPYARHDLQRLDEVEALWRRYGHFDLGFDFGAQLPPAPGRPPCPTSTITPPSGASSPWAPRPSTPPTPATAGGAPTASSPPPSPASTARPSAPPPLTPRPPRPASRLGSPPQPSPPRPSTPTSCTATPAAGYDNATFLVDLPNGDYEVTVVLADRSPDPTDHGPLTLRLQGRHELGPLPVPAGEIVERRQRVQVSAGRLDVEVSAPPQGDWLLTALLVTRVAPHIGHLPPPCARPARPLPLRATVSGPEPLRAVAVRYRYGADGPFQTLPLAPVPEPDAPAGTPGPALHRRAHAPRGGRPLRVLPGSGGRTGTRVTWPPAGPLGPRRLHVGEAGSPPRIAHAPPPPATPGQPLPIRARVSAGAPLARVTLHYRNLNQMQTHDLLPLLPEQEPTGGLAPAAEGVDVTAYGEGREIDLLATIPGEHVDPQWDLMYHLEAVDVLGNGAFFPGLEAGTPYVVLPVRRPTGPRRVEPVPAPGATATMPAMSTTVVPAPTSLLRFGHARAEITPPVGIYHRMWGAARHDRATGVHRPLVADVLVLAPLEPAPPEPAPPEPAPWAAPGAGPPRPGGAAPDPAPGPAPGARRRRRGAPGRRHGRPTPTATPPGGSCPTAAPSPEGS